MYQHTYRLQLYGPSGSEKEYRIIFYRSVMFGTTYQDAYKYLDHPVYAKISLHEHRHFGWRREEGDSRDMHKKVTVFFFQQGLDFFCSFVLTRT